VRTEQRGDVAVVVPTGELDLATAPALEEALGLAFDGGSERVVLDLRELEFMDSSGLRTVALAERGLSAAGRRLVLVRGRETVQRVFTVTRMDEHLTFVDDPESLDGEAAA
jgi:anti-anti-sigma factor